MKIGSFDTDQRTLLVAEVGNNHEGDFGVACRLVDEAARSGVDAVKFQTFRTEHYVSRSDEARFQRLKKFELSRPQFAELSARARAKGLLFMSTPFDLESADFLAGIVDALKIASGDNTFYPLIARAAASGKPLIVSTGLSDEAQVRKTVDFVRGAWAARGQAGELAVLHCVSAYPTPPEQANLASIPYLAKRLPCTVGYSDHTEGVDAAAAAAVLGARVIEKHFTLDKNFSDFRDHKLSADPAGMAELARRVRLWDRLRGREEKAPQAAEAEAAPLLRRSIAAGRDLPAGHRLAFEDLTWIRPGRGLAPGEEARLVGKKLKRAAAFGAFLSEEDVA